MTDTLYVLGDTTRLGPLPDHLRDSLKEHAAPGDFVLSRADTRAPPHLIDAGLAAFLERFRTPSTFVDAVAFHSLDAESDPQELLEAVLPFWRRFTSEGLIESAGTDGKPVDRISVPAIEGYTIERPVRVMQDVSVYRARDSSGRPCAIKITGAVRSSDARSQMANELATLKALDGAPGPELRHAGSSQDRRFVVLGWIDGISGQAMRSRLQALEPGRVGPVKLRCLRAVATAYRDLHARGIVHGDVNFHNIVFADDDTVALIDFGYGHVLGDVPATRVRRRGGVVGFNEPEMAAARLENRGSGYPISYRGEQFGVAALLFALATGASYLDFPIEKEDARRAIVNDAPRPFSALGVTPLPDLERLFATALAKDPVDRFADMAALVDALAAIDPPDTPVPAPQSPARPAAHHGHLCGPAMRADFAMTRNRLLAEIVSRSPRERMPDLAAPRLSVNYGMIGGAIGLLTAAQALADPRLLETADLWLTQIAPELTDEGGFFNAEMGITAGTICPISPYHTESGFHLARGLVAHAMGDFYTFNLACSGYAAAILSPCSTLDLATGASGALLGAALLRRRAPDFGYTPPDPISPSVRPILDEIDGVIIGTPVGPGTGLINGYGVAHGWGGVLYARLVWGRCAGTRPPAAIRARLDELQALGERTAHGIRWPIGRRRTPRRNDYMPSWCNGVGGLVHLWIEADRAFPDAGFLDIALDTAGQILAEPAYGIDLCCGLSGQAYGLLAMYQASGDDAFLTAAEAFAAQAIVKNESRDLQAGVGLFRSSVGLATLLADLEAPAHARLPLFVP